MPNSCANTSTRTRSMPWSTSTSVAASTQVSGVQVLREVAAVRVLVMAGSCT